MPTDPAGPFPLDPGNPHMGEVVVGVDLGLGPDASALAFLPPAKPAAEIPGPDPAELAPGPDGCLYDRERDLLRIARDSAERGQRLEVPWREVPVLVEALEGLGRLRLRGLDRLIADVRAELERGGEATT